MSKRKLRFFYCLSGADGIIHFGPACLTPTVRLPILYIYTVQDLSVETLKKCIASKFGLGDKIAIVYDVQYDKALENFDHSKDILLCKPHPPMPSRKSGEVIECGRKWPEDIMKEAEKWTIIYVGTSENLLSLLTFTFPNSAHFVFDPSKEVLTQSGMKCSKLMMRRYMLVEKTKDAERIGILVGTLGVSRYGQIIEQVKDSIKKANKKAYTFLVGKPNIPKLANFPEIDVFVLIACPENSLLDSKEYLKPIITPFELDVALNSNREWTGVYHANFQDLLPDGSSFKEFEEEKSDGDFSLISGKVRVKDKPALSNEEGALMVQDTRVSNLHANGGGDFLSQRTWQGLEQKLGETKATKAVEGQRGIAWGYANEGQ